MLDAMEMPVRPGGAATLAVGIDIGGTAAKLALVDGDGAVLASDRLPTGRAMAGETLVVQLAARVRALCDGRRIAGIGIGVPATVTAGRPIDPTYCNVPALAGLDICGALSAALGVPAWLENDAKAALRAEWRFGAAKDARNAAIVTLGTGIGSALLLDGRIRDGAHGNHGELGLVMVGPPDALQPLEQRASPGFIAERHGATLPELLAAARGGDRAAAEVIDRAFGYLGTAIANLHLLLDLEVVVLAGAATGMGAELVERVTAAFTAACPKIYRFGLDIRLARLGGLAGAVGAAALAQMSAA